MREFSDLCGPCCVEKATFSGDRIEQFRRLLESSPAEIHVSTVGNSVARSHEFGTTRKFVKLLEARAPKTKFVTHYGNVKGGFLPRQLYSCGLVDVKLRCVLGNCC